jgi:hypothetical protein
MRVGVSVGERWEEIVESGRGDGEIVNEGV